MKDNTTYIDSDIDEMGNLGIGSGVNKQLGNMVNEIQHNLIDIDIGGIGNLGIGSGVYVQLGEVVSERHHHLH